MCHSAVVLKKSTLYDEWSSTCEIGFIVVKNSEIKNSIFLIPLNKLI